MFFPEAMTEVELIVPAKDLLAVTKVLGSYGIFHQIDSTYLGVEGLGPNTWQEKASNYSTLERRIQVIMQNLNLREEYSGKSDVESMTDLASLQAAVDRIEADVKQTTDELTTEKKTLEQLEGQLQQLEPISGTNADIGALRNSRYLYSVAGVMPAESVSRLETSLSRVPHVFFFLREDVKKPVVWLLGLKSNSDIIDRAVKSAYLSPLTLPEEFSGTPAQVAESIRKAIEVSKHRISELDAMLAKLADAHKQELYKILWEVHVSRLTADVIARYGQLRHTYIVVGWVPSVNLDSSTQHLKQVSKEILIESTPMQPTGHRSNVPVALHNPGFLAPFELLVNTYARPRYEEIDPTFLIAVTFPLLYGAMFGDVGHGLVLALFGWLLASKAIPALRGMAGIGGLMVACGLMGTVFGFLYGSVFGFEEILSESPIFGRFVWMRPLHDIIQILSVAIGAGVVILSIGYLLNLYNAFRSKNWARFFFDSNGLAGLIFYWSFLGIFTAALVPGFPIPTIVFVILAVVSVLLCVVFAEPLKHWMEGHRPLIEGGTGIFIVQSGAELLEKIISVFSNTMSYVRVGAFAVAHAGFLLAVFVFAGLASGGKNVGFGYWAVVVFGNLFVIGFEGFIVSIQTMRLHYYEFFSKFFTGGGSPYEPLTLANAQKK